LINLSRCKPVVRKTKEAKKRTPVTRAVGISPARARDDQQNLPMSCGSERNTSATASSFTEIELLGSAPIGQASFELTAVRVI